MQTTWNKTTLDQILCIESESGNTKAMRRFLWDFAERQGWKVRTDRQGNLFMTKGESTTYPAVCAHTDTVHNIAGDGIALVRINGMVTGFNPVTMRQTGIGGDDKCGIYAALWCMHHTPCCKAVFFVDEEIGCVGSGRADLSFFADCRFVLQADRRGGRDFVTDISGPLGSPEFHQAVSPWLKAHGFASVSGAMTDVMELRDRCVGVSVANMSAGYYNPHQACEFINERELQNVCDMMLNICTHVTDVFPFMPARTKHIESATRVRRECCGCGQTHGLKHVQAYGDLCRSCRDSLQLYYHDESLLEEHEEWSSHHVTRHESWPV